MKSHPLSVAAYVVSWSTAYGGAWLNPGEPLPLPFLTIALVAALVHIALELRSSDASPSVVGLVAWLGFLLPLISLRPYFPLVVASIAETERMLQKGPAIAPPAADAPVVSEGGRARLALAAACVIGAIASDGSTTLSSLATPIAFLAMSAVPRAAVSGGWRAALIGLGIVGAIGIFVMGVLGAIVHAADPSSRWRAAPFALAGLALLVIAARRAPAGIDLRHRALQRLSWVAGVATLVLFATSSGSLLALVDTKTALELEAPPVPLALIAAGFEIACVGLIAGLRSKADVGATLTRLRLRWPGLRPIALSAAIALAILLALGFLEERIDSSPEDMALVLRLLGGEASAGMLVMVLTAAVAEETG